LTLVDKRGMVRERKGATMIQWIGILFTFLGLVYTGVKDYQKGEIQLPKVSQQQGLTKPIYPIQYCLVAYDPNLNKFFYLHENGLWYEQPPELRRYETTATQYNQAQNQTPVSSGNGAQGGSRGYLVR